MLLLKRTLTLLLLVLIQVSIVSAQLFTKVTTGAHVNDGKGSRSVNFIDLNNDSFPDLFISNGKSGGENNMVYINNQDGTFTEQLAGDIVSDNRSSDGASFADFNNDGNIDGFVGNWYNQNNLLYQNNDNNNFNLIASQIPSIDNGYTESCSFSDYDNDGDLDLYVANSAGNLNNFFYINNGNGLFTKDTISIITQDADVSRCGVWADYDNDGDADLFVANETGYPNRLYENLGDGTFTKISTGAIVTDMANSWGASWGDYDNDMDLDLFVANNSNGLNFLYINNGDKTFTKDEANAVGFDFSNSVSSSWVDYDNDGDLDLFVANGFGSATQTNLLYTNDGSGNFTKVTGEPIATDQGWAYGSAWADYDKDGDLDLMVAKWLSENEDNAFYNNDTGSFNNWVSIKCIGTESNSSAIGARVSLKATIGGVSVWQTKEISSQHGYCSQNSLQISFGLGDATLIDSIVIDWPNSEQEIQTSVSPNQFLTWYESGIQIKADITFGSAPLQVQFDNITGLTVESYDWDFHDGSSSTISSPQYTFANAGLYDIDLTATTADSQYNANRNQYVAVYGDTIFPVSQESTAGETVNIPLTVINHLPLSSVTIPLQWSGDFNLTYTGISNSGFGSEYMNISVSHFDAFNKRLTIKVESTTEQLLPVGTHILGEISFSIPSNAPNEIVSISFDDYLTNFKEHISPYGNYVPIALGGNIRLSCCVGIRGNVNGGASDQIDISDLVYLVAYSFGTPSGSAPPCFEEADIDGSGGIDITDLVLLVNYSFGTPAGPPPINCF